jgi:RHS repeat-associated protein
VLATGSSRLLGDVAYAPYGETYTQYQSPDLSFSGQNQDTNYNLYDFLAREYDYGLQGRWISPDPVGLAAVDSTNPQSLNRYAYALNSPCSMVDPLGLDSCSFNVQFINDAGLTNAQVTAAEQQINALLGSVASANGDTVGINWVTSGQTDATLTATNQSSLSSLLYGPTMGIYSWWPPLSPRVWVNNLPAYSAPGLVGSVGLHELAHYWLGREQPYNAANLNTLMFDNMTPDTQTAALLNPNSNVWKLTPSQIGSLFQKCPHKQTPGPAGGGGGMTPGGYGYQGTESLVQCSTTYGVSEDGPYSSTSCSTIWSTTYPVKAPRL